jgi:hypothetical protein
MRSGEATGGVIDFLSESSRLLICIDLFDVARASNRAKPSQVRLPHDLRLTQPPLQQCAGLTFFVSEETAPAMPSAKCLVVTVVSAGTAATTDSKPFSHAQSSAPLGL